MLDTAKATHDDKAMRCHIFALIAGLIASPLWADDKIVMQTLDVSTSVPAPPWTQTARIAAETESRRQKSLSLRGTDTFVRAYVPKGQSFEQWSERYEVTAETPVVGDAEDHRNEVAIRYRQSCLNAVLAPVLQTPQRQVYIMFCPSFVDDPEVGELVISVTERRNETVVGVNYLQRVPAFDISDRETFPRTRAEIQDLVKYLNAAHMLPS